jgi:hypothetical protein
MAERARQRTHGCGLAEEAGRHRLPQGADEMAEVCEVWPGAEPARSVLAVLDGLRAVVAAGTGSVVEGTVHARRRGADWFLAAAGERVERAGPVAGGVWAEALDAGRAVVLPDLPDRPGLPDLPDLPDRPGLPDLADLADLADERAGGRAAAARWGAARVAGFRGLVVVPAPLRHGGHVALTLYLEDAGACGPEVVSRAAGVVRQVASLVDLHTTIPARGPEPASAAAAGRTRATVDHAVGVLMEARSCDAEEARHVLTVLSAEQGRALEAVALAVVQHAVRRAPERRALRGV